MALPAAGLAIILAVLLSLHVVFSDVVELAEEIVLSEDDRAALQDLFHSWNKSTPDVNTRLPGWTGFDLGIPYDDPEYVDPCILDAWRGVFCYIELNETASASRSASAKVWDARVVGLEISGASIVGTLPDSLWKCQKLVSIIVTGNPGLTGPISVGPTFHLEDHWTLKRLDLHGNNLTGNIPEPFFTYSWNLEDLDLSNNRLDGPVPQFPDYYVKLSTVNLSQNNFTGTIPWNMSSWTRLVLVDFSSNAFDGSLPSFKSAESLHTLNVSHNGFNGEFNVSEIFNPETKETLATLDCSDNHLTGALPNLTGWSTLQLLNLSGNSFSAGPFPSWLSSLPNLQTLSLRNSILTGELDLAILRSLKKLKILELENNNINATLNFDKLLTMSRDGLLQSISLKHNQIRNVIFSSNNVSSLPITLELQGNPYCIGEIKSDIQRCLCEQNSCYNTDPPNSTKGIIIGSAIAGSVGAVMMIIATLLYWKNRRDRQYLLLAVHEKFAEYEMKPTLFAYNELQKATRDFHPDNKLGEGGFGAVYKGTFANGSVVAVKQLLTNAQQNMDDFLNEVVLLTSVKHRNLVKLKGCCLRGDQRLLVYEFVDNYDLAEHLFEHKGNQVVTWPARFNICLGVAQGLHYLHAGIDPKIIHRDIKPKNVLLDSTFHPKIADFGLAMLFPNADTHITILQVAGTKGYLAPEYATRGQVSDKVDVFSFGVMALEVVSGRKNISFNVVPNQMYLIDWAWTLNQEVRLLELVDPTVSLQSNEEIEVHRVITIALQCVQMMAERRPSMAQVVGMLQGDIEIMEAQRGGSNENVNHHGLLGFNSSATTLSSLDEQSRVLYVEDKSSLGSYNRARPSIELGAFKAR